MSKPRIGREEPWRKLELECSNVRARLSHLEGHAQRRHGSVPDEVRAHRARADELLVRATTVLDAAKRDPDQAWASGHDDLVREIDELLNSIDRLNRKLGLA